MAAKKPRNWLSVEEFMELEPGQKVVLNHFIGTQVLAGKPRKKKGKDSEGNEIKFDCIDVEFVSGPWKGKTLELVRQHIKRVL